MELQTATPKWLNSVKTVLYLLLIGGLIWALYPSVLSLFPAGESEKPWQKPSKDTSLGIDSHAIFPKDTRTYIHQGSTTVLQAGDSVWLYFDWGRKTPRHTKSKMLIPGKIQFMIDNSKVIYTGTPDSEPKLPFRPDSILVWSVDGYTELGWY